MRFIPENLRPEALARQFAFWRQQISGQDNPNQDTPNQLVPGSVQQMAGSEPVLSAIAIGITTGTLGILFDLSFAVLIFSNTLSDYLSAGIGFILFSAAATRIMVGLMSSFPGMVSDLAGIPTAIIAWSTGMVIRNLPTTASSTELLVTVIVTIAFTSSLTGAFLWLMGALKLGSVARLLPDAVVGGFIASSGWLLVKGAFEVLTTQKLTLASIVSFSQSVSPLQWLPGLLLAVYLLIITRRYSHSLVMAGSLVGAIALFYGCLSFTGVSLAQANTQGLTLGIPPLQTTWQLLHWSDLSQINWSAIGSQWMCSGTVSAITAVLLLMNVKSMEVVLSRKIDLNHELKIAGSANVIMGLGGGILSFQSFGRSVLAHNMGGRTRLVTLVGAATFVILPVLFSPWLTYFPTTILGGLLLYLGFSALYEWVYKSRKKLSLFDYGLVQLIWLVSGIVGFLQGLALGWAIAVALMLYQAIVPPKLSS
ncbi:MAG: SulP family inorganic anion transporter [Cyanobacteria bacterium P01_F01_bin.53]